MACQARVFLGRGSSSLLAGRNPGGDDTSAHGQQHRTELNTIRTNAVEAIEAQDYRTALNFCEQAWMIVATLPRSMLDSEEIEWKPEAIKDLMTMLQRRVTSQQAAENCSAGGIIASQPMRFTR